MREIASNTYSAAMIRITDTIRALTGWRRNFLALGLGAAAALAMPPIGLWPVLFLAVPALLLLLEGLKPRSLAQSFLTGWLFGLGYFLPALHWIGYAFLVDAATYLWMMPFAVLGLAAAMAIYWGLAALVVNALALRGLRLVLGFAAVLAIAEWLRGHLFTGFPWAAPGLAVDGMGAVAQLASLAGMTGLTLLIVLWAGLPLVFVGARHRIAAAGLLLLLPIAWGYGWYRLSTAIDTDVADVSLRIVQPNIGQDGKWRGENARPIFDTMLALSSEATAENPQGIASRTHVIWPESAVPFLIDEGGAVALELRQLLGGRTVLITGALRRDLLQGQSFNSVLVHNSVIVFNGLADVAARYDKWRLVPGGEYLPLAGLFQPLGFSRIVTLPGNFVPGPGPATIDIPNAPPVGLLICYEAIFPDRLVDPAKRPQWLLNVTNDGWFGNSTGPWQHLAQARLRTIEQGLPMARAANTGISAVIDPYGRIRAALALGQQGVLDQALPEALPPTVYSRFGDGVFTILLSFILVFAGAIRVKH
ncbi:MAG: apolipoprotein N-acyltransferase [Rhizobiales bacterium]|nr:apolipoprotein N-acyltransferase [Hyphomicrobiales bacterium]